MISAAQVAKIQNALPFWMTLLLVPIAVYGALAGGWTVVLLPLVTWYLFSFLDAILGLNRENADPNTPEDALSWYKAITLIWAPVQFLLLFWMIWYVSGADHLSTLGKIVLFFGVGVITGTVGIVYSHELMHQRDKGERWLADGLLSMVLYSHFHTEHMRVHHPYVGTPRDAVTARYNEGFHRFFLRVLFDTYRSAFRAERRMLARKGLPWWHRSNPFWKYWALDLYMITLAALIGGWVGLGLFLWQAIVAIWQLELTNYVEHYGLTRKYLGAGKYEHVHPHHSWNSAHKATNWLLINLQRHSDHHYKPDRRFPLLQTYDQSIAPQLPFGYPIMTMAAMVPPVWRRFMNPRVRKWRAMYYPEITDWMPYTKAAHPDPAGS